MKDEIYVDKNGDLRAVQPLRTHYPDGTLIPIQETTAYKLGELNKKKENL